MQFKSHVLITVLYPQTSLLQLALLFCKNMN